MKVLGRKFIIRKNNVMTVTSMNSEGVEVWIVDSIIDQDTIYCELHNTNMSMYSGRGYFKEFKLKDIEPNFI